MLLIPRKCGISNLSLYPYVNLKPHRNQGDLILHGRAERRWRRFRSSNQSRPTANPVGSDIHLRLWPMISNSRWQRAGKARTVRETDTTTSPHDFDSSTQPAALEKCKWKKQHWWKVVFLLTLRIKCRHFCILILYLDRVGNEHKIGGEFRKVVFH